MGKIQKTVKQNILFVVIAFVLIVSGFIFFFSGETDRPAIIEPVMAMPIRTPSCVYKGVIEEDQSLFIALTDAGISPGFVDKINRGLTGVYNPRRIRPGYEYSISYSMNMDTLEFILSCSDWESYKVRYTPDTLYGVKDSIELTYNLVAAQGTVENTLWESMREANMAPKLIMNFTDVLSYDFDFVTDTRNGQKFKVLYEQYTFNGEPVKLGRIHYAEYQELCGKKHITCFYEDPAGRKDYYNLDGKSTKRSLLKTPLKYSRISSSYTHSRFHPILKKYRPHLGVDYAAPTGTPVVASGSGKVFFCGWINGYGNSVRISHANSIVTEYHHLSKYAKGIKKGKWVSEGQVIGYVGSTGQSTGPHLDYRVKVKGKYVNPLKYAAPSGPPINSKYKSEYLVYAENIRQLTYALSYNIIQMNDTKGDIVKNIIQETGACEENNEK